MDIDKMLKLGTLHIDAEDVPWVEVLPGISFRILHSRLEDDFYVTEQMSKPGAVSGLHRHFKPVFAWTTQGTWSHEFGDYYYKPGTYVYETENVEHRFFGGPDIAKVFFVVHGGVEFMDLDTKQVTGSFTTQDVVTQYFQKCEEAGLKRPNVLTR